MRTGNTWSLNKQTIEYLVCGDGIILVIEPWINKDMFVNLFAHFRSFWLLKDETDLKHFVVPIDDL